MTPADHANTVREWLRFGQARTITGTDEFAGFQLAVAALDALQTQAERWQEIEHPFDQSEYNAMFERAEAAEAERDQMRVALARMDTAYQEVELIGHQMTTRALAAESERDLALQAASDFRAERDAVVREARKLQAKYDDIRGEYLVLEEERDAEIVAIARAALYAYDPRGVRLMVPHDKDCYLDAHGRQEFIVELRPYGYADKAGRRYKDMRGQMWHRFACNNTSCHAEAWVRMDVLWQFVSHGLARGGEA